MKEPEISIGRAQAIAYYATEWWNRCTALQIVQVQLFTQELCTDIGLFQDCLEKVVGHPVFTHQLATQYELLVDEVVSRLPNRQPPTKDEVTAIIENAILALAGA